MIGDEFEKYEHDVKYLETISYNELSYDKYLLLKPRGLSYKSVKVEDVFIWFNADVLCFISLILFDDDKDVCKRLKNSITSEKCVLGSNSSCWVYLQPRNEFQFEITFSQNELKHLSLINF